MMKMRKIFTVLLVVLVFIVLCEGGLYWWLMSKKGLTKNSFSLEQLFPSKVSETPVRPLEKQDLLSQLPADPNTGFGAHPIPGDNDMINIWGVLNKIDNNKLILVIDNKKIEIITTEETKYSARPKKIISTNNPPNPAEVLKPFSKQNLAVGQELEVIAKLSKAKPSEVVMTALFVSVLE